MSIITDWVATAAIWAGAFHGTLSLLTAVSAGLIAAVFLVLRRQILTEEQWTWYFGLAFAVFAVQYVLQAGVVLSQEHWPNEFSPAVAEFAGWLARSLGSASNNVLFLAAAFSLLGRERLTPPWVLGVALITVAASQLSDPTLQRLPDALFSAYCLLALAWAIYWNFAPAKRRWLPKINLVGGFVYAAANLSSAATPAVATGWIWPSLSRRIADLSQLSAARHLKPALDVVSSIDALTIAVMFVLKICLFAGALILIMRCLSPLSASALEVLREVKQGRGEYLSDSAIVRAVGETVDADLSVLCIRMPGSTPERVIWWRWLSDPTTNPGNPNPEIENMPNPDKSIVASVLHDGRPVKSTNRHKDSRTVGRYREFVPGMTAFVTVPLWYQGAVIGCMNLEWRSRWGFTSTSVQRILQLADLLAPAVHAKRQLYALRDCAEKVRSIGLPGRQSGHEKTLDELTAIVHDALGPAASGITQDLGFQSAWHVRSSVKEFESGSGPAPSAFVMSSLLSSVPDALRRYSVLRNRLEVDGKRIGWLRFAIPTAADPVDRPGLVTDALHRKTVAGLIADAIFQSARLHLGGIMNRLQVRLTSTATTSVSAWHAAIEQAALEAGLEWVVAELKRSDSTIYHGPPAAKAAVAGAIKLGVPSRAPNSAFSLYVARHDNNLRMRIVRIELRSDTYLWLGVGRRHFGRELSFPSPWRTFLTRVQEAADACLVRIERQQLQLEAARLEVVAIKVETTGLVIHELCNLAAELSSGVQRVIDGVSMALQGDAGSLNRLESVQRTVRTFSDLATAIMKPLPSSDGKTAAFDEILATLNNLYHDRLAERGITLTIDAAAAGLVAVPPTVAHLAVMSLVVNAATALGKQPGTITLTCAQSGADLLCDVRDSGPGIPPDIREQIWEIGFTTKSGGSGWGLPLARTSLWRHKGDLTLSDDPGPTCFTIRLPRIVTEETHK